MTMVRLLDPHFPMDMMMMMMMMMMMNFIYNALCIWHQISKCLQK